MKDEHLTNLPPAALSQGACRGPDVDPEWWVGDHAGSSSHRGCHHQEARHICIVHCPVKDACEQWGAENPTQWVGMVVGGHLRITQKYTRRFKLANALPTLQCPLCEPLDE